MCGRTSLFAPASDLRSRFDAAVPDAYRPRYNVAPTEPVEVITADAPAEIQRFYWGLRPSWADGDDEGLINARAETVAEKPAFADAWESRPCLVLSSGFYEWKDTERGGTRPYRVHRADDVAFAMAGIHERWTGDGDALDTVTILTTEPNDLIEPLHHRMAVVLPRDEEETWLTGGPEDRHALCRPYPDDDLDAYPISTAVNDPANDSPGIIEPDESEQSGLGEFV
ncbi:SOS response-associated peptidase [Halorientalis litorea]|jgi:putative SOS response-associated peptidase YedK|uniref:SOS response-associated peptidase n=1 Tax=Halorientalis litorea TaxID=2931977 RepID=UPI001FF68649|nr:SOS response-associated peptidase [Halorientalis litorea]